MLLTGSGVALVWCYALSGIENRAFGSIAQRVKMDANTI